MLLRYVLQIIGSIAIMLYVSPKLGGVLIAVIPLVGILAQRYGKRMFHVIFTFPKNTVLYVLATEN